MTIAISTDRPLPAAASNGGPGVMRTPALGAARPSVFRTVAGVLEDVVLLSLVVLLFPLGILLVGTPIALCVWAVLGIARRL